MIDAVQLVVLFLAILAGVAVLARQIRVGPAILLVIAGVAIAVVPGIPAVELPPELVDLGLLPPILYWAGVTMSWREFKFNLRPIALLAIGCVLVTAGVVAVGAHTLLQLPWTVCLLLGALVSPPDGWSSFTLADPRAIPRRLRVISEGEGLAASVSALVLYRFALGAVVEGVFSPLEAIETFVLIVPGEIAFGLVIGWIGLRLRRRLAEPRVELVVALITPYVAYWVPAYVGGTGVLSVVAAGMYVSWRGPLLISAATRVQGIFFWDLFDYVIEGFVFLFTGLQVRAVIASATAVAWLDVGALTALTVVLILMTRAVWIFAQAYVARWLVPAISRRDPVPSWQTLLGLSLGAVRGVVPLAAALAIPSMLADGSPFPNRDLILVVTYGVIVVTLVLTVVGVPFMVGLLGLARDAEAERLAEQNAELEARFEALEIAEKRLGEISSARSLPALVAGVLSDHHRDLRRQLPMVIADEAGLLILGNSVRIELIEAQRQHLHRLLREGRLTDEARRRIERDLDFQAISLVVPEPSALEANPPPASGGAPLTIPADRQGVFSGPTG